MKDVNVERPRLKAVERHRMRRRIIGDSVALCGKAFEDRGGRAYNVC
jgi:hypothetical protein